MTGSTPLACSSSHCPRSPRLSVIALLWYALGCHAAVVLLLIVFVGALVVNKASPPASQACSKWLSLSRPIQLNHYKYRSYDEYVGRRKKDKDKGWREWKEMADRSQCENIDIQRFLPGLRKLRTLTWTERRERYHQIGSCVDGQAGRDCRDYFAVAVTSVSNEDQYLAEWLDFHTLVGFDHFVLYDFASSSHARAVLGPYIEIGAVTLINWGPGTADRQREESYRCHSHAVLKARTFWVGNFELDEYMYPLRGDSLRALLAPMAERQGHPYAAVYVRYNTFSGAPFVHPPPGRHQLENYVRVERLPDELSQLGKHLALLDALDDREGKCRAHHLPELKPGYEQAPDSVGTVSGAFHPASLLRSPLAYRVESDFVFQIVKRSVTHWRFKQNVCLLLAAPCSVMFCIVLLLRAHGQQPFGHAWKHFRSPRWKYVACVALVVTYAFFSTFPGYGQTTTQQIRLR
eukprot:TRINITY_DN58410_c0_g1_i1.p1 TRINITY_DN58410_c0_g1~~TRINITY_DN58410_c0_g1_i1.p1  ORF type:complete len:462 (+),score=-9.86 TRINITY_DN58410_c0_g1_i1:160-1545(+)